MRPLPETADVVIVGSGPVGSAFARLVKDAVPGATVVMLERGPVLTEPAGVNVRNLSVAERSQAQRLAEGRGGQEVEEYVAKHGEPLLRPRPGTRAVRLSPAASDPQSGMPGALVADTVGGMGSLWTCAVPRPLGAERIPFLSPDVLDTALSTAESLLGMTTAGYPRTVSGELVLSRLATEFDPQQGAGPRVSPMPLAARRGEGEAHPRWTGADVVLGRLASSTGGEDGFWILAECAATRILLEGDVAVGVEARRAGSGETLRLGARAVVVAADALRTPQLLWASGIRPEALGRYLNDQMQIIAAAVLADEVAPSGGGGGGEVETAGLEADAAHPFHGSPEGGQESVTGVSWIPFDAERGRPFHGQAMQLDASPIAIGDESAPSSGPVVGIGFFAAKELQASDRVRFDPGEPDEFGLPAIRIDYELTEQDRRRLDEGVVLADRAVRALGDYAPGGRPLVLPAGSSIHYQGTVRMGESDDGTSVCDTSSRVWRLRNLFVGGNGVIPTSTGCNPTLTSVALASIAAARIVELLR